MLDNMFTNLKKDGWYFKLLKYVWNMTHKDFQFGCPFFWMTVISVPISVIIFPFKTILWRWILCNLWNGFIWMCNGLERHAKKMADDYDRWCLRQQERYEEERKSKIISLDRDTIKRVLDIPDNILKSLEASYDEAKDRWERYTHEDRVNTFYHTKLKEFGGEKKKKGKEWKLWWTTFLGLHQSDKESFNKVVEKRQEVLEYNKREATIAPHTKFPSPIATTEMAKETTEPVTIAPIIKEKQPLTLRELRRIARREEKEKKREERRLFKEAKKEEKRLKRLEYRAIKEEEYRVEAEKRKIAWHITEKLRIERNMARAIYKADVAKRNKERINRILKVAKPIATVGIWAVGIAIAGVGLFFVYKLILFIGKAISSIKHSTWSQLGNVSKWIGLGVGAFIVIIGLIYVIVWLKKNIKLPKVKLPKIRIPIPKIKNPLANMNISIPVVKIPNMDRHIPEVDLSKPLAVFFTKFAKTIWYILKTIWKGLGYAIWPFKKAVWGVKTLIKIVKQTYNNNCPAITYKD